MSQSKYRPEIDGLRAIAVIPVVLFHAGFGFTGGYVGVDVFFVISGFLITGIILRAIATDSYSLVEFWERRIRRIFPAMISMVLVTLVAGCFLLLPSELEELGESSLAQTVFLANVYFWRHVGYFDGPADVKPLLHTWSLAIEEQFYFFFPLLLIAFRRQSRRRLLCVMLFLTATSFLASVYGTRLSPDATFFLLPTRCWELFAGCLLAAAPLQLVSRPRFDTVLGIAGLFGILAAVFLYSTQTPFPGIAALPPVLGTVAILYSTAATPKTVIAQILSFPPLVFVGMISYSLYLWHWPIFAFFRIYERTSTEQMLLALLLSLVISIASWRFIETPLRGKFIVKRRSTVFVVGALCSALTLTTSLFLATTGGLKQLFPSELLPAIEDLSYSGEEYESVTPEVFNITDAKRLGRQATRDESVDFVLWGDSHGMAIASLIDQIATSNDLAGIALLDRGTCPLPNLWRPRKLGDIGGAKQRAVSAAFMNYLETTPPKNLLLVARWSYYCVGYSKLELEPDANTPKSNDLFAVVDHDGPSGPPSESSHVVERQLSRLISRCKELNIKLWILMQVPETGESFPAKSFLMWNLGRRSTPPDGTCSIVEHHDRQRIPEMIFGKFKNRSQVEFVDPAPFYFDANRMTVNYKDGRSFYRDSDHVTRRVR